ncbi:hypothetical protein EalM132_00085 [Exiguobacterium phage vB_EalM-132]|nr:hypothetical protein EalM132_00085 [Exiguobacterium phage vB_EalM-132]
MSLLKKLHAIYTKNPQSEIGYLTGAVDASLAKSVDTITDLAEIQSNIKSAQGEWLDTWGEKFYVSRDGMSDSAYRTAILNRVKGTSSSVPALEWAVKRALGDDTLVRIEETYEDLRIFNVSTFSGHGKFQDSDTVRLGVVKIYINKPENQKLREEIYRSRGTGIRVIIVVE